MIENYEEAMNDTAHTWDCHHRAEILPCGRFKIEDLKKHGLYYDRPAKELVFLKHKDHLCLHLGGVPLTPEMRRKISEANKGKPKSEETKRKISEARKGFHWSMEQRQRMSETRKGKKAKPFSEEHKRKLSEAMKGRIPWNKGLKTGRKHRNDLCPVQHTMRQSNPQP